LTGQFTNHHPKLLIDLKLWHQQLTCMVPPGFGPKAVTITSLHTAADEGCSQRPQPATEFGRATASTCVSSSCPSPSLLP